jgi:hypothetical protein
MKIFWLKADEGLIMLGGYVFAFVLTTIVVEALVMFLFRVNRFGKSLVDSVMANIGSILLFILLFLIFNKNEFEGVSQVTELMVFFFIASIFEAWIVKLLNPGTGWGRILVAGFVMNLFSFGLAYLFLTMEISI